MSRQTYRIPLPSLSTSAGSSSPGTKPLFKVLACALLVVALLVQDSDSPLTRGAGGLWAQDDKTAAELFRDHISGPVVQSKCVNCHVQGGVSGHTRLVLVRSSDAADHAARNLRTFEDILDDLADEGGGSYILNKIQGVAHGGGVQVPVGSADFANMERFLGLLGEEITFAALTPETLFDTVLLASPRKTLRRAALIFAGRIPTDAEYAAVEDGDEWDLRATIRGLMEGPEFHEFLLRASNDRLLTDRQGANVIGESNFVHYTNERYRLREAAHASDDAQEAYGAWESYVQYGARRAPLELIAYVVTNDLPYTEILTADYIMANPWAAAAYGASTQFDDLTDAHEFKPSQIVSYYLKGDGFEDEYDPVLQAQRVLNPGPLIIDYPHAGILNTGAFLQRYPSTATNRNRARAHWTYYHFLGLDVEKSASRTTDPVALADTDNPTMHNPACTVCHSVLDPVAGAFQNYGDDGLYRDQRGGLDSLDEFYKEAGPSLVIQAESWAEREALIWSVSLAGGAQTLRVIFTNPGFDESTDTKRFVYLDRISVIDGNGKVIVSQEFEDLEPPTHPHGQECGWALHNSVTGRHDHIFLHAGGRHCAIFIDVPIPANGLYDVEIVAWSHGAWDELAKLDEPAELSIVANAYEEGDTWYRDMRVPGFAGAAAPHPDNSIQWLARQIVADERFAEATVKFWWPAIMGSEMAEFPEEAADADFEGLLLAANAEDAEVVRLASGFRDGFPGSPYIYNLKDLLVEIVMSKWFRADALTDTDPVRRVALRNAGAWRLLTPEELARKTAAVTGFQWGRHIRTGCHPECNRIPNELTAEYRLLYGGIDSDGITERARDITPVMAGVAESHAAQVSCPVIMREVYLLPDSERRLFAGIAPYVTPVSEFSGTFEITAASRSEMETLSLQGHLTAGGKTVSLAFLNEYYETREEDRDVLLDRLTVRQGNTVVYRYEMENLRPDHGCYHVEQDAFHLSGSGPECVSAVPVAIPSDGVYQIEISAWGDQAGDEFPRLSVVVESNTAGSAGSATIRSKLVELHDKLLGVQVAPDSPDVEAAYRLFVDAWQRKRKSEGRNTYMFDFQWQWQRCDWQRDIFFYEGILDGAVVEYENEHGRYFDFDWDRVHAFLDGIDFSDPHYAAQTWVVVLAAMMMDDRYLYLN